MTDGQPNRALRVVQDERPRLPSLARHLEPARLIQAHGEAIQRAVMSRFEDDLLRTARGRAALEAVLAKVPTLSVLAQVADEVTAALEVKPSRSVSAAAVAILFDSRARQAANPTVYVEAMIYDLVDEGFPPAVVVAACQKLRREATFTPEIAEVLKTCRDVLARYRGVARLARALADDRMDAEERLLAAKQAEKAQGCDTPKTR